jgi:hypothetical protein
VLGWRSRRPDDGDEDETPARKKQRLSGGGGGGSAYISADLPRRSLSEQAPADRLLALRRLLEATIDWDGSVPMLGRAVAQSSFLIPLPACLPYVPIDENVQRVSAPSPPPPFQPPPLSVHR